MKKHPKCRRTCMWCLLQTVGFPFEHFIWERLPGFALVTHALGL